MASNNSAKKIEALEARIAQLEDYNVQLVLEAMCYRAGLEKALGRELTDAENEYYMSGGYVAA